MKTCLSACFAIVAALFGASAALAALPAGYTEVIYIASSGTQYIDTGVVPTTTTRLVCDFRFTAMPTDRVRNGWSSGGSVEAFWFGTDNDHVNFSCSVSGNSVQSNTGVPVDTARHTFDISTSAIKFDGATVANPGSAFTAAASGNTMYLFASRQGWNPPIGAYGKMELYSCRIYSGDTLVRAFVPAVRDSDSAAGLYDSVTGGFFTNRGTGAFTAGGVKYSDRFVATAVATCYASLDEIAAGVEPEVSVYDETTDSPLVLGRDYTVAYQDNTSVGTAKAVVTGTGDYAGESADVLFAIVCAKAVDTGRSLSADEDWTTGYEFVRVAEGATIDLRGHNLTVSGLDGLGTITDSVGGGELHYAVPASYASGYQATITGVTLTGKLTLVKEGPGVLAVVKEGQTFTGGTRIVSGVVKYACGDSRIDATHPLGYTSATAMGPVTIEEGGILDPAGSQGWGNHTLIVNGGMISNTVAGANLTFGIFNPKATVNGDFTFAAKQDYGWTAGELGGQTCTVDVATSKSMYVATFSANPPLAEGGRIVLTGGGYLRTFSGATRTNFFNTVDLETAAGALWLDSAMIVHDYTPASAINKGRGSAALNVLGTFTPASDYFYGPTMQDGSTIDLSAKAGAWSATSSLTEGGNATTKFAANATITVTLGDRRCKVGDRVIAWTTAPDASVSFTGRKATFESRSDGLYVTEWNGPGLVIIVR